ncbi:S-adenosyl-L-methionine-dependent methyltransferase [Trichoderma camerunense]
MPTSPTDIANLYNILGAGELSRLDTHPVELLVTLRTIREALPQGPQRIADVGGGPGKYAFALADQGHLVDLVDLSPGLIQIAQVEQDKRNAAGKENLLQSLAVGNALDPNILQHSVYDAVLLLGPLYHLVEESERVNAVANAVRLAKPNGVLFVAFVSISAHLRDIAMRDPSRLIAEKDFYAKYLQDGRYEKFKPGVGNVHSFHTQVRDIRSFFADNFADTLELMELRSQEGILGGSLDTALSKSQPQVVQAWADLMYEKYSTGEEHLGCADHLIAILKKRDL